MLDAARTPQQPLYGYPQPTAPHQAPTKKETESPLMYLFDRMSAGRKKFLDGVTAKVLKIINRIEEKEQITTNDIVLCSLLRVFLLIEHNSYEKAYRYAEQAYEKSLELERNILSVDALNAMVRIIFATHYTRSEKIERLINHSEKLLSSITELPQKYKIRREGQLSFLKGLYFDPFYSEISSSLCFRAAILYDSAPRGVLI